MWSGQGDELFADICTKKVLRVETARTASTNARPARAARSAAVARFDGHVAKWMGDGALVYFGYPRAHEDDEVDRCRSNSASMRSRSSSAAR
jgi:class 3 adenylate cyclase